jgi:misacylated tRNA(Ala) deacylase
MTEALYLSATDRRAFEATVERTAGDRVVLDRTCFHPAGGGQPHDTGTLSAGDLNWRVTDVTKSDTVYHHLEGDPPAPGTAVAGEVDWERRYAHMRYHTAQHLLSALLLEAFDARTTGNQLYADHAHLDCAYERFTETDLADVEVRLNDLVESALPVRWYDLDRGLAEEHLDAERTRLYLLPDSISEIRIVEIGRADDPFDRTACAGTHVAGTDEIGEVTVTGRETKGAEAERLHFELG